MKVNSIQTTKNLFQNLTFIRMNLFFQTSAQNIRKEETVLESHIIQCIYLIKKHLMKLELLNIMTILLIGI